MGLQMSMAEYLQIKAVSAGVLRTLIEECPYAAWFSSPFNPNPPPADDTDASDAGTIAHSILLEGNAEGVAVFDPADFPNLKGEGTARGWTNKAIKDARDLARSLGKIPVLSADYAFIKDAVHSASRFIESLMHTEPAVNRAFSPLGGVSEQTIMFDDDGLLCKIRPDRMAVDHSVIVDAKFPAQASEPESWSRSQLVGRGLYLSASWYQRIVELATGVRPEYLYLVTPTVPPHLPFLVGVDPHLLDLGHRKIDFAVRQWRKCAASGVWPGYEPRVYYAECPPWEETKWTEREAMNLELGSQP